MCKIQERICVAAVFLAEAHLSITVSLSLSLRMWCRTAACLRSDRMRILISVLFAWWDPAYRANPQFGF
jgi:hypothetical protein